jgi:uncharacterized membrane protein
MLYVDSHDVLQALFRWIHILAAITWIGLLYFLNFINVHVQRALEDSVRTQLIRELLPRTLWWFRWGAMCTFLSGYLLLLWKYFLLGSGVLGDAGLLGSSAGLWISLGVVLGTMMWWNVWFIIWPAQQRLIRWTREGKTPPEQPATAKKALLASRVNTFLSVPLVFVMLAGSGHYPSIGFQPLSVIVVLGIGFGLAYVLIFRVGPAVGKTEEESRL